MVIPATAPVVNEEMKEEMIKVFESKSFLRGKAVKEFENDFAKYIGVKYAIATNSGMSAILLSLLAMGVEKGDKVITTPATFISTANAIILAGGEPVFADIDVNSCNISSDEVRKLMEKYNDKVKAIMPVHLYGYPCDMDALLEISNKYNVKIIEDASQAHGAKYSNKKIGSIGVVGAFSFYPTKIITVGGDGGMITTNNEAIAEKCRELRDDGKAKDDAYTYNSIGYAARLSNISAAIGRIQLRQVDGWNRNRTRIANFYLSGLSGTGDIELPPKANGEYDRVWYAFTIRTGYRGQLKEYLERHGICCEISYKTPVHLQPSYRRLGFEKGMYPNSERWSNEILSIPLYSQITVRDASYVISHIKKFYREEI